MRILITQFGNETNTFALGRTDFASFLPDGWVPAADVLRLYKGTSTYIGGAIQAILDEGEEPLPIDMATRSGNFGAGPLMKEECASYAMDHISEQVKAHAGEFDGVFFAVHGGGCSENAPDLEVYSFERMRSVIGDIPMMSSLDVHGNITKEMTELSDGLFGIKQIPHTDCKEAGYLAAKMLIAKIRGVAQPKMALRRLPMLISPTDGCTLNEPGKTILPYFAEYVKEHKLLDATFFYGFASTDRPASSCSVLVVADGYTPDAEADELAAFVWARHKDFVGESLTVSQALDRALTLVKDGYVVINEASDNPGGGCPGDGTHLLREMVERNLPGMIMGPIYDPELAAELHAHHHVGDLVNISIGGKTDPICGAPVELKDALIVNLADGKLVSQAPINKGASMDYGKSVRLRHGNVEIIVVSVRFQVYDDRPFMMTGADMTRYRIVGLKSMNHFRGYFLSHADAIVTADPPGQCPSNLNLYNYEHVLRPIYPLDPDVEYTGVWPL